MSDSLGHVALITARDFRTKARCTSCLIEAPTFAGICLHCFRAWKDANLEAFLAASVRLVQMRRLP